MPHLRRSLFLTAWLSVFTLSALAQEQAAPAGPIPAPTSPGAPTPPPAAPVTTISSARPGRDSGKDATIGPIKFGDITVDSALERLEAWTGRTVLRPAGLPATSLTFNINQKVTRAEAIQALETLLTLSGIAVTPLGEKFLKVTPLANARSEAPDFIEGSTLGLPPSGRIASKLFQLKFLRVGEFVPQLTNILQAAVGAAPVVFEKTNAMLITDSVTNLQRVESLIASLDSPALDGLIPKFYKVQNTTASELVTKLQSLLNGASAAQLGTGTIFQADDRTNQIILMSDPRQVPFFDDLIAKLDIAGESSTRQEVIPLQHADATDVATVLTSLISGQVAASRTATQNSQNQAAARNTAAALTALAGRNTTTNGNQPTAANGANRAATTGANGAVRTNPITVNGPNGSFVIPGFNSAGGTSDALQQFSTILTVVPDERSNSLVVSGTVDDMRLIKDIVSHLDVLLAQVRIEVVIAEVSLDDAATSGLDSLGLVISGNKLVAFNGSGAGGSVAGSPGTSGTPGAFATLYDATSGARNLAATLSLNTTPRKNNTTILSVPTIVTSHNKEASIFVGESLPVITSYQNTGVSTSTVGSGYTSNVTYKDIGINLTVKPLIGRDGSVQLDIKQDVNDILSYISIDGNSQPVIGSRTTESFVSVQSGEIVVLGGLQRKLRSNSTNRLGPIPIIGDLLGKRTRDDTRTDLVFFLRPYVLTNTPADNTEAMQRLKLSPQHDDVQAALKGEAPTKK